MANTRNEGTSNRGFASMDPDEQREIASGGGRAAHASGNAHEFTSEEAREAGRAAHASGNAHEFTSEEARRAGARSHINDDNRRGRNRDDDDDNRRGRSRDDDNDDDRRGRSSSSGTRKRDRYGRFTSD